MDSAGTVEGKRGYTMIDFNIELKKFKPAVGVEVGQTDLFEEDVKDITDLVEEMVQELSNSKKND